jgi:hypothetical protein
MGADRAGPQRSRLRITHPMLRKINEMGEDLHGPLFSKLERCL